MTTIDLPANGTSKTMLWTGRVLSAIVILFCVFDFSLKFTGMPIVTQTGEQLGWHAGTAPMLGVILAVCIALYAFPRTSILGAILLTGYLGGAIATHVRVESPLFSHILFGVYLGLMAGAACGCVIRSFGRSSRSRVNHTATNGEAMARTRWVGGRHGVRA